MRIGLLHPTSLLGQELRERLTGTLGSGAEWTLMGTDDEIGTVTEIDRLPALVEDAATVDMGSLDLLITCGASRGELAQLTSPGGGPLVLQVAAESVSDDGLPMVAGLTALDPDQRSLVAANAITIVLASVLDALADVGVRRLTTTVLLPVSVHGRSALDEVLDQARALLAFQEVPPASVLGAQLAFNLLPPATPGRLAPDPADLRRELEAVSGQELEASFALLHAGVFHGLGILTRLELGTALDPAEVRARLLTSPRLAEPPHADVGPIDTASREDVIVGSLSRAERPDTYWLWLLADNLALTAANAVAIVESLTADTTPNRAN